MPKNRDLSKLFYIVPPELFLYSLKTEILAHLFFFKECIFYRKVEHPLEKEVSSKREILEHFIKKFKIFHIISKQKF